jgi:hypothetical protein
MQAWRVEENSRFSLATRLGYIVGFGNNGVYVDNRDHVRPTKRVISTSVTMLVGGELRAMSLERTQYTSASTMGKAAWHCRTTWWAVANLWIEDL